MRRRRLRLRAKMPARGMQRPRPIAQTLPPRPPPYRRPRLRLRPQRLRPRSSLDSSAGSRACLVFLPLRLHKRLLNRRCQSRLPSRGATAARGTAKAGAGKVKQDRGETANNDAAGAEVAVDAMAIDAAAPLLANVAKRVPQREPHAKVAKCANPVRTANLVNSARPANPVKAARAANLVKAVSPASRVRREKANVARAEKGANRRLALKRQTPASQRNSTGRPACRTQAWETCKPRFPSDLLVRAANVETGVIAETAESKATEPSGYRMPTARPRAFRRRRSLGRKRRPMSRVPAARAVSAAMAAVSGDRMAAGLRVQPIFKSTTVRLLPSPPPRPRRPKSSKAMPRPVEAVMNAAGGRAIAMAAIGVNAARAKRSLARMDSATPPPSRLQRASRKRSPLHLGERPNRRHFV